MLKTLNKKYLYQVFVFISLLVSPVIVLAPLGSWIPLVLSSLFILFFLKSIFKDIFKGSLNQILWVALTWILLNTIFIGQDFDLLKNFLHFFLFVITSFILNIAILKVPNFNRIIILFSFSFLLSALLVILDITLNLGLKLWLSKNLDFGNFKSFFQLETWVSLNDFRQFYTDKIIIFLQSAYDRGITSLTILALPITLICIFYNYYLLAIFVILVSLALAFLNSSMATILGYCISIPLAGIFYFQKKIFKKYFIFLFALYFLASPFILGILDYKKYSKYETKVLLQQKPLETEICTPNNTSLYLICHKNLIYNVDPYYFLKPNKLIALLKLKLVMAVEQSLHRLVMWSYVKEKIIEKPMLGHGFFSSRNIANEHLITTNKTNYQLISLHPHNNILQIWLELGLIGLTIFFVFIKFLLKKIYLIDKYNHKVATVSLISFFQIFIIGHLSYGFWQSWWLSIILINFILYSLLFKKIELGELPLDSSS
jgi:hypothetical protein